MNTTRSGSIAPTSTLKKSHRPQGYVVGLSLSLPLAILVMTFLSLPALGQVASALLNPLVAAWIRSTVDQVDDLQVQVQGSDGEILGGTIPQASVSGNNIRYQGFQITQLQLNGQQIQLNVSEAIQGQPLKLQNPIPVQVLMRLTEADLNQTLQAPLIQAQLAKAQVELPAGNESVPFLISNPQVELDPDLVRIQATLTTPDQTQVPFNMVTGLRAQNQNQLVLVNPQWVSNGQSLPIAGLDNLALQLDSDVQINQIEIIQDQILYDGSLTIQPEEISTTAQ